jgi:hypothetical protein
MKQWFVGLPVVGLLAVCGGALASFGSPAPAQEVARESLDLLKAMRAHSATAQSYVASCITAIAVAKRQEVRKNASPANVQGTWTAAAGRCRGLASTVCEVWAQQAPREACMRIRSFERLL